MGNTGSNHGGSRRRQHPHPIHYHGPPPPQAHQQQPPTDPRPELSGNRYVFAAATPYPPPPPLPLHHQYPNPNNMPPHHNNHYPYPNYYPHPQPLPLPHHHHHQAQYGYYNHEHGRSPPSFGPVMQPIEHQKAVTIRNDVNLKKETLRIEIDEDNPGNFVVAFTFDADAPGSITIMFFSKEDVDCTLVTTKGDELKPVTVPFEKGLGQKFRQPCGTGIDLSKFENAELTATGESEIYPLVVKAEAYPAATNQSESEAKPGGNSQITLAAFKNKDNGEYQVQVLKQILWVNGMRYELQEIYGIGNTVEGDLDDNDPGKECVICLSEPRDTTVLPCRHMCMCSGCAKVLRFQTNRCPICRQPVERLLEIKVNNEGSETSDC
ncbi:hypothetical protein ACFE04_004860 [Oxalis oulophora]